MNFGMTILIQSTKENENYATWILKPLLFVLEPEIFIKTANDVEEWFDTSNYSKDDKRPLPIDKKKKKIGFSKDELGGKIMKEFVELRAKIYAYLMDDDTEHTKAKGTKKFVIKRGVMLKN